MDASVRFVGGAVRAWSVPLRAPAQAELPTCNVDWFTSPTHDATCAFNFEQGTFLLAEERHVEESDASAASVQHEDVVGCVNELKTIKAACLASHTGAMVLQCRAEELDCANGYPEVLSDSTWETACTPAELVEAARGGERL
jgi:hypothetical protein